ncbi:hypothetical protein ACP4OV_001844 [Aristida adscensionis]
MRKLLVVELLGGRRAKDAWRAREAEVDKLISRLTHSEGKPVSLEDHIFGLVDGIIGTVALGNIHGRKQFTDQKHFHDVFEEAMSAKASFSAENYFPNVVGRLIDRLTGVISRRENYFPNPSRSMGDSNGPDFIDVLIGLVNNEDQTSLRFTKDHVKGLLSNRFSGGVDTSSVTMVWAMAEVMKNPMVLKKAQEEIRSVVGNKERVQPDDVPKLKYLKMVVKEALRLHPTAPLLAPRETIRHVKICGYDVPAKTRLLVNVWAIGRDTASWDNPHEFNQKDSKERRTSLMGRILSWYHSVLAAECA